MNNQDAIIILLIWTLLLAGLSFYASNTIEAWQDDLQIKQMVIQGGKNDATRVELQKKEGITAGR